MTHKLRILGLLYKSELKLTATDFHYISNANQYFCELEHQGFIKSEYGKLGKAKVKFRFIPNELRPKAERYLKLFGRLKKTKDEV